VQRRATGKHRSQQVQAEAAMGVPRRLTMQIERNDAVNWVSLGRARVRSIREEEIVRDTYAAVHSSLSGVSSNVKQTLAEASRIEELKAQKVQLSKDAEWNPNAYGMTRKASK